MNEYFETLINNNSGIIVELKNNIKEVLSLKRGTLDERISYLYDYYKDKSDDIKFSSIFDYYDFIYLSKPSKSFHKNFCTFYFSGNQFSDYNLGFEYEIKPNDYGALKIFIELKKILVIDKKKNLLFSFSENLNQISLIVEDITYGIFLNEDGSFKCYDNFINSNDIPDKIKNIDYFLTIRELSLLNSGIVLKSIYEYNTLSEEQKDFILLSSDIDISKNIHIFEPKNLIFSEKAVLKENIFVKLKNKIFNF